MKNDTLTTLAYTLGLTTDDLTTILSQHQPTTPPTLNIGPPNYHGGHYATISIHDIP